MITLSIVSNFFVLFLLYMYFIFIFFLSHYKSSVVSKLPILFCLKNKEYNVRSVPARTLYIELQYCIVNHIMYNRKKVLEEFMKRNKRSI